MKKLSILLVFLTAGIIVGCSDDDKDNPSNNTKNVASCEGCHTNYDHLKAVYTPDTETPVGGCGGDAPHFEPYDRVYMGGAGYQSFKNSAHGKMKCTDCHNGVDNTADKAVAHSGNFLKSPSDSAVAKCGKCHSTYANNQHYNLHQGWGQKRKVCLRSGLSGADDFTQLPAKHQQGYNKNCSICHASCGDCHVNRPHAGGGGLAQGHNFKEPDMMNTCVVCHSSRGGHAFLGVGSGTQPDVHLTKAGFNCLSCHKKDELHGDGKKVEQRYAYEKLPKCDDCHKNIASSNTYHSVHADDFNCHVCHSQNYNTCGSCHIGGAGARITSHLDFKIALNPIPDIKKNYKFTLVRRTLAAPDNWSMYDVPQYAKFEAAPTFNYTSPHNILKRTARTNVAQGEACYANCHIYKDGDVWKNKNLYLFDSDLYDWEKQASKNIVVDGKLPASWGVK